MNDQPLTDVLNPGSLLAVPYRPTARTEARRLAAREGILDAAQALVARGGFAAVSMQAVAARAGVATGTVYRHFPGKADLLAEVFRRASEREAAVTRAAAEEPGTPAERLTRAVETFARRALRGRRLAWALLAEPADPAVEAERLAFRREHRDAFAAVVADAVAEGAVPAQDPAVTAAALVGAVGESLVGPLAPTRRLAAAEADALVADLVAFCLRAAGLPAGRPVPDPA